MISVRGGNLIFLECLVSLAKDRNDVHEIVFKILIQTETLTQDNFIFILF